MSRIDKDENLIAVPLSMIDNIFTGDDVALEDAIQPIDLTVYMMFKRKAIKEVGCDAIKNRLLLKTDDRIVKVQHEYFSLKTMANKLFKENRNYFTTRKGVLVDSISRLIDNSFIIGAVKGDDDIIVYIISNGNQYKDAIKNNEKNIVLYFVIRQEEKFTYVPELYFNKIVNYYKTVGRSRVESVGYYVFLTVAIFKHLIYGQSENGGLILETEECYLLPDETKYFTRRRRLWDKVDDVLGAAGILHQFRRFVGNNGTIITNQYFGIGSGESLNMFVEQKVKKLKENNNYKSIVDDTVEQLKAEIDLPIQTETIDSMTAAPQPSVISTDLKKEEQEPESLPELAYEQLAHEQKTHEQKTEENIEIKTDVEKNKNLYEKDSDWIIDYESEEYKERVDRLQEEKKRKQKNMICKIPNW